MKMSNYWFVKAGIKNLCERNYDVNFNEIDFDAYYDSRMGMAENWYNTFKFMVLSKTEKQDRILYYDDSMMEFYRNIKFNFF